MAVYRFRVWFEDNEDVSRDIDILSSQTFEDFFRIILESVSFDQKHAASFFVSDSQWRQNDEIVLRKEDADASARLMSKTKISSAIIEPKQKFIFMYDHDVMWTFHIEMLKIAEEEKKVKYPCCIKSNGIAPKQYKNLKPIADNPLDGLLGAALLSPNEEDADAYKFAKALEDGEIDEELEEEEGTDKKKENFTEEADEVYSDEDENEFEGIDGEEEQGDDFGASSHGGDDRYED